VKVYNYGSINIDQIYRIGHFVKPGETLSSKNYYRMLGGKGANQSIALAKAGTQVYHIGKINTSDQWIKEKLNEYGVNTDNIQKTDKEATGHAIIQVTDEGENSIILYGGANQSHTYDELNNLLNQANEDDWLLLQNECNLTQEVIELAKNKGMTIAFNPAPFSKNVHDIPLEYIDYLIVNEIEAEDLLNTHDVKQFIKKDKPQNLLEHLHTYYPTIRIVMTLGSEGVIYKDKEQTIHIEAEKVNVVDTTAAGDTFIGYFIQQMINGKSSNKAQDSSRKNNLVKNALTLANKASSITVQTLGASDSIPNIEQINSLNTSD